MGIVKIVFRWKGMKEEVESRYRNLVRCTHSSSAAPSCATSRSSRTEASAAQNVGNHVEDGNDDLK